MPTRKAAGGGAPTPPPHMATEYPALPRTESRRIFALAPENVHKRHERNHKRRERVSRVLFVSIMATAAVYLVAHVAVASFGAPTYVAAIVSAAAGVYTVARLMREVPR